MSSNAPRIIFEDEDLLVISKPAGLVVNRADSVDSETLQDWTEKYLGIVSTEYRMENAMEKLFLERSGIAHRLDKETSGVMVIGKNPLALQSLMNQFKNRETSKEYLALVHGIIQPHSGTINLPLARSSFNRHRFAVDVFGKVAQTSYQVEKELNTFCLVRLWPKTGRTHQIRVHLSHIGHPLVGDEVYGGRKRSNRDRTWCPRHFLHAAVLTITHPKTGERRKFESALPPDLKGTLDVAESL